MNNRELENTLKKIAKRLTNDKKYRDVKEKKIHLEHCENGSDVYYFGNYILTIQCHKIIPTELCNLIAENLFIGLEDEG
jgi:predicted ribosome-associated RNA-binding protein Tma20